MGAAAPQVEAISRGVAGVVTPNPAHADTSGA